MTNRRAIAALGFLLAAPAPAGDLAALLERIHRQLHLAASGELDSRAAGSDPAPPTAQAAAAEGGDAPAGGPRVIDLRFKDHDSVNPDPPPERGDLASRFAASAADHGETAPAAAKPREALTGLAAEELRFLLVGPELKGKAPDPLPHDAEQRRAQLLALFTDDHFVDDLVGRASARLISPRAVLQLATAPRASSALERARGRILAHGIETVQAARLELLAEMSGEIERLCAEGLARAGEDLRQQEIQSPRLHRALDSARDLASKQADGRVQALDAEVSARLAAALADAGTGR